MLDFNTLVQQGAAHAWLYIPVAILLGALHGLEPGHSKTMMAAFIIAVRGTMAQAVLLGVSAAFSHSLIIWLLAGLALHYGGQWNAEQTEPYFQLASAVLIAGLAAWMFFRTRRELHAAHTHSHNHGHDHAHGESFVLDLGHGKLELSVFEGGVPPVFRLRAPTGEKLPAATDVMLETVRPDGARQVFRFTVKKDFLESTVNIPEPHEFGVTVTVGHDSHSHACRVEFRENAHHHHHGEDDGSKEFQDAHELAHVQNIEKRFAGRTVTTPQIVLFGLTGGLMPCPAAFTILLVCLQLKKVTLGFALVASFSFGLALTMVFTGVLAAWSVHHAQRKFQGFGEAMRRAPYISCAVLLVLAAYMAWRGWQGLHGASLKPGTALRNAACPARVVV
jgi:nickel/cobalt exporter